MALCTSSYTDEVNRFSLIRKSFLKVCLASVIGFHLGGGPGISPL